MPEDAVGLIEMSSDEHLHGTEVRRARHALALPGEWHAVGGHLVPEERDRSDQEERTTRRVHPRERVPVVSEPSLFAPDLPGRKQAEQRGGREVLHVQPGKEASHETEEHPGSERPSFRRALCRFRWIDVRFAVPQPDGEPQDDNPSQQVAVYLSGTEQHHRAKQ